ncbi:MAG: hypothetical protein ABWZ40_10210 [Caulobacterales bacterium]
MPLFRFEHHSEKMASAPVFIGRLAINLGAACVMIAIVLGLGMTGYHVIEHMPWIDAFLNSSMLLGGMGPVDTMKTEGGKLFAGSYALVCGLVIVAATAIFLAPVMHRVLHAVHADDEGD